ncbi:uncharacterized protein SAZU_5549 [Streptomyces azureus]|uniref:Uncharacterized protein n=1 Tax=Streptomyces azureus TaxID=146537 RepID=A0A0K8PS03_STRAJ|nr:uncharacterized protein SAZU_5549 [Streptomyces azureus]
MLALLRPAGFDEATTVVDNPDEADPAFRIGLHRLSARELPTLRETAAALAEQGGPEGLAAGLDALFDSFTSGSPSAASG